MFGMGWTELLLIGMVALIVVGPKELPGLFRNIGQFVGRARGMAREFSRAMEDAADQSGMKDATNVFKGLSDPKRYGLDKVKQATDFTKWTPDSNTAKLAEERAAAAKKIHAATADAAQKRLDAAASAGTETGLAVPKIAPVKNPTTPDALPAPQQQPRAQIRRPAKSINRPVRKAAPAQSRKAKPAPTKKG
ncbi:Sec-independent protein translocase protein TatB [Pseudooceanicola spongiae]|jgi:sec-independent protein translocase protein TatB|uniref:Sec-independent protein translocase protein TatB n=1 Tax=Pseudooceanicola spongiae TaxID=2613965 RepID=A0A7L9WKZ4_9RHOB|nr:Sec-independent protein translocase protein TatB [Pseudooceanicola spongiae]QOL80612.1 twin-arginine translocase subunit TatB [Pseudooceanicola spongiae]